MNIATHLWARADQEPVQPAIRSNPADLSLPRAVQAHA